ncbi:hypothetical protein GCM10010869_50470 [Mesorhizobium tianshanense]|uniref:hypothetical protein n=1 Tax=Mesorhizobium tianshanense TaxID=39844 RepID=UPI0012DF5034|nr:hypothetical protein [Mesorhizobium tianshanense]GLS39450.1 hypothetical protein GCM10010869_50470 [Mesorhizobium tianshanense]
MALAAIRAEAMALAAIKAEAMALAAIAAKAARTKELATTGPALRPPLPSVSSRP